VKDEEKEGEKKEEGRSSGYVLNSRSESQFIKFIFHSPVLT
jgi:hypothetical protein